MSDIVKTLRDQSKEIDAQGISGWGNTMSDAADYIEELERQLALVTSPKYLTDALEQIAEDQGIIILSKHSDS